MGKGSNWERDICKYLSKWIQGTEKPYLFWRGRGSGASFTKDNLIGESFAGDIYHIREEGKFLTNKWTIECKNGYNLASLDKHLKENKNDEIKSFWIQATTDAKKVNKDPVLIFRKKGFKTPWIGINKKTFNIFNKYLKEIRFIHLKWNNLDDIYFFEIYKFFKLITPEIFKENYEDNN